MATSKGRKGRAKKNTSNRKSRLWLRDLLNLLGGLLVGAVGFWLVQEFLEGRSGGDASEKYRNAIQEDLPFLKHASEDYEALVEGQGEGPELLKGLDMTGALYGLDAYRGVHQDLSSLHVEARPLLLAFYLNLRDAELLRKLIVEQREHPEEMSQILTREFLRTLHEGRQLVPRLLLALGEKEEPRPGP